MAESKEPTFSDSLNIANMVILKHKKGIYLLAGNPTPNNWIRVVELFKPYTTAKMTSLKDISFISNFVIRSTKKQDYQVGQLLDNLFKLSDGKVYTKAINKTFAKKIAPSLLIIDTEWQEKKFIKLVSYYNYIIENIESSYDFKMSEEKELLTTKS